MWPGWATYPPSFPQIASPSPLARYVVNCNVINRNSVEEFKGGGTALEWKEGKLSFLRAGRQGQMLVSGHSSTLDCQESPDCLGSKDNLRENIHHDYMRALYGFRVCV